MDDHHSDTGLTETDLIQFNSTAHDIEDHDSSGDQEFHEPLESSSLHMSDALDSTNLGNETALSPEEKAIRRRLDDVESSFLPEPESARAGSESKGFDDTYLNLGDGDEQQEIETSEDTEAHANGRSAYGQVTSQDIEDDTKTGGRRSRLDDSKPYLISIDGDHLDSPSVAASIRNEKRGMSYGSSRTPLVGRPSLINAPQRQDSRASNSRSPTKDRPSSFSRRQSDASETLAVPEITTTAPSPQKATSPSKRPQSAHSRQPSQTSSIGGFSDLSMGSHSTVGADYALQTGTAAPNDSPLSNRFARDLSRLPSFGSVASEMSRDGDRGMPSFNRSFSAVSTANGLNRTRIDEEDVSSASPNTPRAPSFQPPHGVTDTVITQHVQNIQVPDTVAQDFRSRFRPASPEKRSVSVSTQSRPQSTLTLKEQNSKIDKLTKENFDLKLKIHFLDQALQNRSDEGIKDMINANVTFQTDLAKERRDNQTLRRRIRDLEKLLGEAEDQLADVKEASEEARMNAREEVEIEITELREQLDHAQVRITKLSADNLAKEMERRRMSEYVDAMQERKGSVGDEEMDMWRDLLTEEQGRREMAEEEGRKLREEIAKLKTERLRRQREDDRDRSRSTAARQVDDRSGAMSGSTLVDQLRHENTELKRDLGAQSSMLTSRNKERERLQQEIEDLKMLNRRHGDADSIFERSASRAARANSRVSGLTGARSLEDAERDEYERREGLLRDENAQLRLQYQDLGKEADARMDYIAQLEEDLKTAELELSNAVEDIRALQRERDDALAALEQRESEIDKLSEDYKRLEEEAVANIEGLEANMATYESSKAHVAGELLQRNEDFAHLQAELRSVATKLMHFEGDRDASLKRIAVLERELDDATAELETLERKLREAEQKTQRLEVQGESLQNEISFLREEQEADKVKIGDLSNELLAAHQAVRDEKEKMAELETSLTEERRQREVIDDQEKQEVQKVIADLNSDNARTRDDLRRLRRGLSAKESEAETYRVRLEDLETNLRRVLGDVAGTRSTLLQDVERLQHDLSRTAQDLEAARADVADKERLIKSRDVLLESSGLEARRLSDLLDKERQGRKHDLHNFELAQRGNSTHLRALASHESRTTELEAALAQAKRRASQAESGLKDQLAERNTALLSLWVRLSALCGPEWARQHGTLNGNEPNADNIARFWTQFHRNIVAATTHIESLFTALRNRIRAAEKQMTKDVSHLNAELSQRIKQLEALEQSVSEVTEVNLQLRTAIANSNASHSTAVRSPSVMSMTSTSGGNKLTKVHQEEMNRLRAEVKTLKAELKIHRSSSADTERPSRRSSVLGLVRGDSSSSKSGESRLSPAAIGKFLRHPSDSHVRSLNLHEPETPSSTGTVVDTSLVRAESSGPSASDEKWLHRVRELERRLKAEREARLLDRKGARERLEARQEENDRLRARIERREGDDGRSIQHDTHNTGDGEQSDFGAARASMEIESTVGTAAGEGEGQMGAISVERKAPRKIRVGGKG